MPAQLHAIVSDNNRFFKRARDMGARIDHGGQKAPTPTSLRPAKMANGAARIDDNEHADDVHWIVEPLDKADGPKDVPWNISAPTAETVAQVEALVQESLARARSGTHIAYLQILPGMMPRVVGRGGSGLQRMRDVGVIVEVMGVRDADTCKFFSLLVSVLGNLFLVSLVGAPDQLEAAREIALDLINMGRH